MFIELLFPTLCACATHQLNEFGFQGGINLTHELKIGAGTTEGQWENYHTGHDVVLLTAEYQPSGYYGVIVAGLHAMNADGYCIPAVNGLQRCVQTGRPHSWAEVAPFAALPVYKGLSTRIYALPDVLRPKKSQIEFSIRWEQ
jgi:hypothetical protein